MDPKSLFDLHIPEQFRKTKNAAQFLLHDSGPSNNRIIIFSTHDNLDIMGYNSDWFADSTFKTSSLIFSQASVNENIIIYYTHYLCFTAEQKRRIFVY